MPFNQLDQRRSLVSQPMQGVIERLERAQHPETDERAAAPVQEFAQALPQPRSIGDE